MSPFIRRVKTSSGATAVQIAEKRRGVRTILRHIGWAHGEAELALLMVVAQQELHEGQDTLDLDLEPAAVPRSGARVLSSASEILWHVLVDAYRELGFDGSSQLRL